MKIIRAKDYNDMSRKAANIISAQVILKPESVLGILRLARLKSSIPKSISLLYLL